MNEPGGTHLVFVAGLSGSGKTTAMAALEDLSFYCVDNLPAQLVPQFLSLCAKATPPIEKIAVAVDTREEPFLRSLPGVVASLREEASRVEVIFLDCADDVLEGRYRETRRVHPLSPEGGVSRGIERERKLLVDVSTLADFRVDTTTLNVHQLKETIIRHVSGETRETVVNIVSFGFRYGTPHTAELLFDMRFLPNPYFEPSLRSGTGQDAAVARFVLESERGEALRRRLEDFIEWVLPMYDAEGKAYVTIGIGCTGGRHRSVAVTEALAARLRELGRDVNVTHRDVGRGAMSVGVVLVTHHQLGAQLVAVLEQIIPEAPTFHPVSVDPDQGVEAIRDNIRAGLRAADEGDGVLILTDMFGGTPSNVSLSFLEEHHVEVVTGTNLPMLIKLATLREEKPLEELATFIMEYGRRNISVANQLLPDGSET